MAEPQFYHWAEHIHNKGQDTLICNICKKEGALPKEPIEAVKPNDITRAKWLNRIRAIGAFVSMHRDCYVSSSSSS